MLSSVIVAFVELFVGVFNFILLARVISSWIYPDPYANAATRTLHSLTEPVLSPVRKLLPHMNGLDLAPLITFFLLQLLARSVHSLL
jgi:YggT family protein